MADTRETLDLLASAELWESGADDGSGTLPVLFVAGSEPVLFVAGWEDADPFCAAVCTNDIGLGFCRRCPERVVRRVLQEHHPARDRCSAGVGLLAFPVPRGSRRQVAVLRLGRPTAHQAGAVARRVRVSAATLRRAAMLADDPQPRAVLAAARALRRAPTLTAWRVRTRDMAAGRRRSTAAALAQMIVTGDEYETLYRAARRQLRELERNRRRLDTLARDAIEQLERTRASIAHELHDGPAQSLVAARRHLEAARVLAGRDATQGGRDATLDEQLGLAVDRLTNAVAETRTVLRGLLPPGLEELGLGAALEMRIRSLRTELASQSGPAAVPLIAVTGSMPRLTSSTEQALFGMVSEALTNAVRHAGATRIDVSLTTRGRRAILEVRDDGRGFDPRLAARAAGNGRLGLLGIVRQSHWLGGSATIHSRPGAGTQIRISVPLERKEADASAACAAEA